MSKKFLSIKIEPERLLGYLFQAISKNEKLSLTVSENDNTTPNSPDFVNQQQGFSVWVKDSKFD